jgi:HEAT repeat protein
MRAWKLHFCWALFAMGTAGAWGRWTVTQRETVLQARETDAGPRSVPVSGIPAAAAPVEGNPPLSPAATPALVRVPPDFHLLPDPYDLSVEEIRRLMKSGQFREVYQALSALGHVKDRALKRELILEFIKCDNPQIRRNAMHELVALTGNDAVPFVQDILRSDPENSIRREAAEVLGRLSDQGSVALLLTSYREGDSDLKIAAAASLYRFGHPGEAAETLTRLSAGLDHPDGSMRKEAVEQIGRLNTPLAIPILTRALRDPNGDVRIEAVGALGAIDAPGIVDLLEPLLKDPFADVREYTQDAIDTYRAKHPK